MAYDEFNTNRIFFFIVYSVGFSHGFKKGECSLTNLDTNQKNDLTSPICCAKILFCSVRNRNKHLTAGVVQLVERLLAKEKVVSSSLIARSLPD